MDIEEFMRILFKDMADNLISELTNVVNSAESDGLINLPEYKELLEKLSDLCHSALSQIPNRVK